MLLPTLINKTQVEFSSKLDTLHDLFLKLLKCQIMQNSDMTFCPLQ